ncbi:hypothetical protein ACFQL4_18335 [Halosimplex aquaticum]
MFDEVHTYSGLFGSYTSMLVKRMRALRRERFGSDDLQVIASSATVGNHDELFRKVSGVGSIEHVDEDSRELNYESPNGLPATLIDSDISEEDLIKMGREPSATPNAFGDSTFLVEDHKSLSNNELADAVSDQLFDYLTRENPGSRVVRAIQELHSDLHEEPRTRDSFLSDIQAKYGLDEADAETLLSNFRTIGEFSGLLENRSHLFSWPMDGFYSCATCDAVYRSPRDTCGECGDRFVTRSTYCNHCAEESLMSWYCPGCGQLESYMPTEHGGVEQSSRECQRCSAARDEEVGMLRVTFRPYLECDSCGHVEKRSTTSACPACDAPTVRTDGGVAVCTNPHCERELTISSNCSNCGGENRHLKTRPEAGDCPSCGRSYERIPAGGIECECGEVVVNTHLLPGYAERTTATHSISRPSLRERVTAAPEHLPRLDSTRFWSDRSARTAKRR